MLINVNVISSSNNTIVCVSTLKNDVLFCGSCGFLNVKGAKRSTFYAGQKIAILLGKKLYFMGFKYMFLSIKGFGNGRYSSIKGFGSTGLIILNIQDKTPIPFNGCRASKKRRI
jgi:small subunit ribosomal protein S11